MRANPPPFKDSQDIVSQHIDGVSSLNGRSMSVFHQVPPRPWISILFSTIKSCTKRLDIKR